MTHAAWGIHRQLLQSEGFDPSSEEYYDELDKRLKQNFPQKLGGGQSQAQTNRATRNVQTVAPASRSSGINNARRTVKLTPSQVAIAKKLGVPLEEYAKYVKE
jgi:phage I-like protein